MRLECPMPVQTYEKITLGHGGGGKLSQRLISEIILPSLGNEYLNELHDGAIVHFHGNLMAFTTDSFVISPAFFPGGNIGTLAVNGTANDLAMCGARPLYLSLAFILEEGFPVERLQEIVEEIRRNCVHSGLQIITGDMKVVEHGKGDGIFINTSGIGEVLPYADISPTRVVPGDKIILSGSIAEHGIAIMSLREGLEFESELKSDSAFLWPAAERILEVGKWKIHAMRDATRGGVASVLNEIAASAKCGMVIDEWTIPVREEVKGACEILGIDPLFVANEGKFVTFVAPEKSKEVLDALKNHPLGMDAQIIGEVVAAHPKIVRLNTALGGSRVLEMLSGEQLPRIC